MLEGGEPEIVEETKSNMKEKDIDMKKKKHSSKRSRSSKNVRSKSSSSCSTKAICTLLITIVCLACLGVGAFYLYRQLSRHTCNAFGISYPRSNYFICSFMYRPSGAGSSGHLRKVDFYHRFWR